MRLQVGREISIDLADKFGIDRTRFVLKSGKIRVSYENIPRDDKGWTDCTHLLPANYDLVDVKTLAGKECPAWWAEKKWEGLRLRKKDKIKKWKFTSRRGE